ncbi:MAG: proline dehydrogenase [Sphingomonadales bacterium]|nr:proline dehydrogenase [Sphingomonadales bacterium]MDE2168243.1 proline dehydrogenase [Sphingomonadales bacterium]
MSLWSRLRDLRYALPAALGAALPEPDAVWAAGQAHRLAARGMDASFGYFHKADATPDAVLAAELTLAQALRGSGAVLAVKAPALGFCAGRIAALAACGMPMMLDSHGPAQADATLALADRHEGLGCAIPARWQRSRGDALRLRDSLAPLRLVKGEWADPTGDPPDLCDAFLDLVAALAGRSAPVIIASHDPALVAPALDRLIASGTPCLLEQLRGLPRRRTMALARARSVAVRIYTPTGPGWWPYAIDKALARPYLPVWWWRDRLGLPDRR